MSHGKPAFAIIGATGTQGGATARALLAGGHHVRAVTRDPSSAKARALAEAGAEIVVADLNDATSLAPVLDGATGVFSVQRPDLDNSNSERRHGFALIEAARAAGVRQFVHSSVCQNGTHESFPRWEDGYWSRSYWTDKWVVEEAVRDAGFPAWTILRPSFIMENLTRAKAAFLFPQLTDGVLLTPVVPDAPMQLIAGDDIGAFARAAFEQPERFNGKVVELVGDTMTFPDMASTMSRALDGPVEACSVSADEALAAGISAHWTRSQEWINVVGYRADTETQKGFDVALTPFADWLAAHRAEISIARRG